MAETNETCPRCKSKVVFAGDKGLRHYECESIDYSDGHRFVSVACRDKTISALQQSVRERDEQLAEVTRERETEKQRADDTEQCVRDVLVTICDADEGGELWKMLYAMPIHRVAQYVYDQEEKEEFFVDSILAEKSAATARAEAAERERDEANRLRMQFIKDTVEDMECLPTCDEIGHDEMCPVTNEAEAWRLLRVRLEAAEREVERLKDGRKATLERLEAILGRPGSFANTHRLVSNLVSGLRTEVSDA